MLGLLLPVGLKIVDLFLSKHAKDSEAYARFQEFKGAMERAGFIRSVQVRDDLAQQHEQLKDLDKPPTSSPGSP